MSKYGPADARTQWFQDRYPGAALNLSAATTVVVLHTTEGTSWPGYSGGATAPTYTAQPDMRAKRLDWRQHFPDERSARALVNLSGGVETNTCNAEQVELVGTCDPRHRTSWGSLRAGRDYFYWPDAPDWALDAVADFLADQHRRHGLRLEAPTFKAYPGSYGTNNGVRMTGAQWRKFTGVCGHQHVPENVHGDPGDLPVEKILALAKAKVEPKPAPTPTPAPTPKSYRGGTWNLRVGRKVDTVVEEVTGLLVMDDLDFLCVQEAAQYLGVKMRRALRKEGYVLVRRWAPDRGARDSAVIARASLKPRGPRLHRLGGVQWERGKGRKGLHWPRSAQSLRLGWLDRTLSIHQAPGPFGPKFPLRRKANATGFDILAKIVNRWTANGLVWVAAGDENRRPADPVVKEFIAKTGATVTGDGIDWIASHGVDVTNVRRHRYGTSDHKPVTFTVTKES